MTAWLRRDRARSGAAAIRWLAVVVVLCQAAAWVHGAAIPHVTCAEHGESVHLAAGGGQAGVQGLPSVSMGAPADTVAHAHEHCGVPSQGTSSGPVPERSSADLVAVAPPTPVTAPARPAAALLRLAPKTSPPPAPAA